MVWNFANCLCWKPLRTTCSQDDSPVPASSTLVLGATRLLAKLPQLELPKTNWARHVIATLETVRLHLSAEQCHLAIFSKNNGLALIVSSPGCETPRTDGSPETYSWRPEGQPLVLEDSGSLWPSLQLGEGRLPVLLTREGAAELLPADGAPAGPNAAPPPPSSPGAAAVGRRTPCDGPRSSLVTVRRGDLLALPYSARGQLTAALLLGWSDSEDGCSGGSSGGGGGEAAEAARAAGGRLLSADDVQALERLAQFMLYGMFAQSEHAAYLGMVADALVPLPQCRTVHQLFGCALAAAQGLLAARTRLQLTPVLALTVPRGAAAAEGSVTRGSIATHGSPDQAAFFVLRDGERAGVALSWPQPMAQPPSGFSSSGVQPGGRRLLQSLPSMPTGWAGLQFERALEQLPPNSPCGSFVSSARRDGDTTSQSQLNSPYATYSRLDEEAPKVRATVSPLQQTLLLEALHPRPVPAATATASSAVIAAAAASAAAAAEPSGLVCHSVPDAAALLLSASAWAPCAELQLLGCLAGRQRVGSIALCAERPAAPPLAAAPPPPGRPFDRRSAGGMSDDDGFMLRLSQLPHVDPQGLEKAWPFGGSGARGGKPVPAMAATGPAGAPPASASATVSAVGGFERASSGEVPSDAIGGARLPRRAVTAMQALTVEEAGELSGGGGGGVLKAAEQLSAAVWAPPPLPPPPPPTLALYAASGSVLSESELRLVSEELEALMQVLLPSLHHALRGRLAEEWALLRSSLNPNRAQTRAHSGPRRFEAKPHVNGGSGMEGRGGGKGAQASHQPWPTRTTPDTDRAAANAAANAAGPSATHASALPASLLRDGGADIGPGVGVQSARLLAQGPTIIDPLSLVPGPAVPPPPPPAGLAAPPAVDVHKPQLAKHRQLDASGSGGVTASGAGVASASRLSRSAMPRTPEGTAHGPSSTEALAGRDAGAFVETEASRSRELSAQSLPPSLAQSPSPPASGSHPPLRAASGQGLTGKRAAARLRSLGQYMLSRLGNAGGSGGGGGGGSPRGGGGAGGNVSSPAALFAGSVPDTQGCNPPPRVLSHEALASQPFAERTPAPDGEETAVCPHATGGGTTAVAAAAAAAAVDGADTPALTLSSADDTEFDLSLSASQVLPPVPHLAHAGGGGGGAVGGGSSLLGGPSLQWGVLSTDPSEPVQSGSTWGMVPVPSLLRAMSQPVPFTQLSVLFEAVPQPSPMVLMVDTLVACLHAAAAGAGQGAGPGAGPAGGAAGGGGVALPLPGAQGAGANEAAAEGAAMGALDRPGALLPSAPPRRAAWASPHSDLKTLNVGDSTRVGVGWGVWVCSHLDLPARACARACAVRTPGASPS